MDTLVIYTILVEEDLDGKLHPDRKEVETYNETLKEVEALIISKGKVVYKSYYTID